MNIRRSLTFTLVAAVLVAVSSAHAGNRDCTGESFAKIASLFKAVNAKFMETHIEVTNCDPELIRSKQAIVDFLSHISKVINARQAGSAEVRHLGDKNTAGYSGVQFVERGHITVDVANHSNNVYVNIRTFQPHNPYDAAQSAKEFFYAEKANANINVRQ